MEVRWGNSLLQDTEVMPVLAYAGYFSYRDIFLYEDEVISV